MCPECKAYVPKLWAGQQKKLNVQERRQRTEKEDREARQERLAPYSLTRFEKILSGLVVLSLPIGYIGTLVIFDTFPMLGSGIVILALVVLIVKIIRYPNKKKSSQDHMLLEDASQRPSHRWLSARKKLGISIGCFAIFGVALFAVNLVMVRTSPIDPSLSGALLAAADTGQTETVKSLLKKGADPNARDKQCAALRYASEGGHSEVVALLLKYGADVNEKANYGWTPLHGACRKSHNLEVVKMLLRRGADVNATTDVASPTLGGITPLSGQKITPLMEAAKYGNTEIISLLLRNNAEINAKNKVGESALDIAVREGHTSTAKFLEEHGATRSTLSSAKRKLPPEVCKAVNRFLKKTEAARNIAYNDIRESEINKAYTEVMLVIQPLISSGDYDPKGLEAHAIIVASTAKLPNAWTYIEFKQKCSEMENAACGQ